MRIADYTTRANYQENYRKSNREAINARKREWRKQRKAVPPLLPTSRSDAEASAQGSGSTA